MLVWLGQSQVGWNGQCFGISGLFAGQETQFAQTPSRHHPKGKKSVGHGQQSQRNRQPDKPVFEQNAFHRYQAGVLFGNGPVAGKFGEGAKAKNV